MSLATGSVAASSPVALPQDEVCSNGVVVPNPEDDRALVLACRALLEGKDTIAGDGTLNWSADVPLSEWEGNVRVTPELVTLANGDVVLTKVAVEFDGRGLTGCIPTEPGNTHGAEILLESDDMDLCAWESPEPPSTDPYEEGSCANGIVVPYPTANPHLVMSCEALLKAKDAIAGSAELHWSADIPLRDWRRGLRFVIVEREGRSGDISRTIFIVQFDGRGLNGCIPGSAASNTRFVVSISSKQLDSCEG